MGCADCGSRAVQPSTGELTVALAGNPNCGKTALFNALTGVRQRTGNWPGVTVDRKEGRFDVDHRRVTLVDLPGTYSLTSFSLEERVARDFLISEKPDVIVNVVDASSLKRSLYFTFQVLEMGVPVVVALNMMDVARRNGTKVDAQALEQPQAGIEVNADGQCVDGPLHCFLPPEGVIKSRSKTWPRLPTQAPLACCASTSRRLRHRRGGSCGRYP